MSPATGAILCLFYILGLLSTNTEWGKFAVLAIGIVAALALPRWWRSGPKFTIWLVAGIIGCLAAFYFQFRLPQPGLTDISRSIPQTEGTTQEQLVNVQGKIQTSPRVTRSQRSQFLLTADQLSEVQGRGDQPATTGRKVTGNVYVTVPLLQSTGLYPGQTVVVTGVLYQPKPAINPGGFDFQAYLAREGIFAGLSGRQVMIPEEATQPNWGWWKVRQRIVRTQVKALGVPAGPLLSSMVMGKQAVDLDYALRDQFVQSGLAHALAASGFQISLLLGVVLAVSRRLSPKTQFLLGVTMIGVFVALTGIQPSVMRAAVMGIGALVALVMQRKVRSLGTLLLAAALLLIYNPLWIWDLGFQLSFLATLGLLVTVPAVTKWLDGFPPTIASLIAIPLAVFPWTLPLQLSVFGVVAPYSILANILTSPLIAIISLGGMTSALAAVIWPESGSAIAWLFYYPTHWLINLVEFFSQLPGNSLSIGTISTVQLLALYILIVLVWLSRWWSPRWWLATILGIIIIALPVLQAKTNLFRVTVLATGNEPVLVVQDQYQVTLVNSGNAETAIFTVLPFLQQQGVNQINWAVSSNASPGIRNGWGQILEQLPIQQFYFAPNSNGSGENAQNSPLQVILRNVQARRGTYQELPLAQSLQLGSTSLQFIQNNPGIVQLQIAQKSWLVLGNSSNDLTNNSGGLAANTKPQISTLSKVDVLVWSGEKISDEEMKALNPQVAIAFSRILDRETAAKLQANKVKVYWTGSDGAIQWSPQDGFETTMEQTLGDNAI